MPDQPPPTVRVARRAEARAREALVDTRIVAIVGPRQSGKTNLVRKIASENGHAFVTLDDEPLRQFAAADPAGFMRAFGTSVSPS